ncbi:MAG: Uncharacterised protein [Hyphomonas sp. TMED17]|nr:MAG: Uncharacterised protein [Hyphomonas sp. TMED17]
MCRFASPVGRKSAVIADTGLFAIDRLKPDFVLVPVYPSEIGVRAEAGQFGMLPGFELVNMQIDNRVRPTGSWIALGDQLALILGNIQPVDDINAAFIKFGIGEIPVRRAPPISGISRHFLLCDELCDAIRNPGIRCGCRADGGFLPGYEVDTVETAVANKARILAIRRNFRIILEALRLR